jgi:hypothetical protein
MIFKEVKLKRDSWHYRLTDRMFGPLPTFSNFCPYFWLTVFCVVVSPLFFAGVGLKWSFMNLPRVLTPLGVLLAPVGALLVKVLEWALVRFESVIDSALCMPLEAATITGISDEKLLDLYRHSRYNFMDRYQYSEDMAYRSLLSNAEDRKQRTLWARMDHKFQAWMNGKGEGWRAELEAAKARVIAEREENERAQAVRDAVRAAASKAADARRRQMLNNIVKYTKIVTPIVLSILALIPLYFSFLLLRIVIGLPWAHIGLEILKLPLYLLMAIWWVIKLPYRAMMIFSLGERLAIISLPFVAAVLIRLSRKCDLELPFTVAFGGFFRRLSRWGDSVNEFGEFMFEGFKMWKRDNCPQIIWEE